MDDSNASNAITDFFKSQVGKGKRFKTIADMVRFLEIDPKTRTTLDKFLNGANTQYGYVFDWLTKLGAQVVFPDEKLSGFELVPRVKAIVGAGESFVTEDGVAGMYAFRREFLDKINVSAKNAVMMYVSGDSMMPMICDGDTVLFNSADTEPREGYIYVCSFGDALMVKRLQMIPGGWQLCSENSRYSPIPIVGDELDQFRVHGRVRWFGRIV